MSRFVFTSHLCDVLGFPHEKQFDKEELLWQKLLNNELRV